MDIMDVNESESGSPWLTETDLQEIPQEIQNVRPPCGKYLRNIMQFYGYARNESIIKFKDKQEMDKMQLSESDHVI